MKTPYSYHIFLFPFKWDYFKNTRNTRENNFSDRTSLKRFHELLDTDNQWDSEEYKLIESDDYNEYTYFYNFVRDAIFDTEANKLEENKILNHYAYKLPNNDVKYSIKLIDQEKEEGKYELNVENIFLHVFTTGVAFLSFHLANCQPDKPKNPLKFEDILKINEYGRRIYPQFLDTEQPFLKKTKEKFLADEIEIIGIQNTKENFSGYENNIQELNPTNIFRLPRFIKTLLGSNFATEFKIGKIILKPLIDDRMFVISWLGNSLIHKLQHLKKRTGQYNLSFLLTKLHKY